MASWILATVLMILLAVDFIYCASTRRSPVDPSNSGTIASSNITNKNNTLSSSSLPSNTPLGNSQQPSPLAKSSKAFAPLAPLGSDAGLGTVKTTPPRPQDIPRLTSILTTTPLQTLPATTLMVRTTEETTVQPEEATAASGIPCRAKFRPHPTNPRMFEIAPALYSFHGEYQFCASTLVWSQENCQCDWPVRTSMLDPKCGEYRKHPNKSKPWLYQRLVQFEWRDYSCSIFVKGLWSEKGCKCIFGPNLENSSNIKIPKTDPVPKRISRCIVVSNLTMDERLDKDYSGGHVTMGRNSRVRIAPTKGGTGKVALVRRSPVQIDSFYANDLTDTVRFAFNFKVHKYSERSRRFMVLLTNGCWERRRKFKIPPSVEIRFRPYDQTFIVKFATNGRRISKRVRANKDKNGWYKVILFLQDKVMKLIVNGRSIYSINGMSGQLLQRECKLMLAGSPYNSRDHFDGYLDEFISIKQCRCDCLKGPTSNLAN